MLKRGFQMWSLQLIKKHYRANILVGNAFSTKSAPNHSTLEDWQYVQKISKQLKNDNLNQALKYVIQSHLNNQILNKQIYYTLQEKFEESSLELDYFELLYKLYRQHFKPNHLMKNWMKRVATGQNQRLLQQLRKDFQYLNEPFPQNDELHNQNSNEEHSQTTKQSENDVVKGRKSRKVPTYDKASSTDDYYNKSPQQILVKKKQNLSVYSEKATKENLNESNNQGEKQQNNKKPLQIEGRQQIQQIIEKMLNEYGKVTLQNVEIQFDFGNNNQFQIDEEMNENFSVQNDTYFEEDQHHQSQDIEQNNIQDNLLDLFYAIDKIKIGKITFQNSKTLENLRNMSHEESPNRKKQDE